MHWTDRQDDQLDVSDSWLVEQCAAFLNGTYRELLIRRGAAVPAWAWVNALAHGDEEEVRGRAAGPTAHDSCESYVARLARHTLVKMRIEGVSLKEVQNSVLVPLELALVTRVGATTPEHLTLSRAVAHELLRGLDPIDVARHAE